MFVPFPSDLHSWYLDANARSRTACPSKAPRRVIASERDQRKIDEHTVTLAIVASAGSSNMYRNDALHTRSHHLSRSWPLRTAGSCSVHRTHARSCSVLLLLPGSIKPNPREEKKLQSGSTYDMGHTLLSHTVQRLRGQRLSDALCDGVYFIFTPLLLRCVALLSTLSCLVLIHL